jgi:hypothetical protein
MKARTALTALAATETVAIGTGARPRAEPTARPLRDHPRSARPARTDGPCVRWAYAVAGMFLTARLGLEASWGVWRSARGLRATATGHLVGGLLRSRPQPLEQRRRPRTRLRGVRGQLAGERAAIARARVLVPGGSHARVHAQLVRLAMRWTATERAPSIP